jgi:hypothetical protein
VAYLLEAGNDHWNFNPDGTNSSGFSARGGGWATLTGGTYNFANLGAAAGWWKLDSCALGTYTGMPFTIMSGNPFILTDNQCRSFSTGYSIRCVKD